MFGVKKTISIDHAAQSFVSALIDDVSDTYASNMKLLKEWIRDKDDLANVVKNWPWAFSIAIFSMEIAAVVNLLPQEIARRVVESSMKYFTLRLEMYQGNLADDINEYIECFKTGDKKAIINKIATILYHKLGIKELDMRDRLGTYMPDSQIVLALETILTTSVGRWKRITDVYNLR